MQRPSDKKPIPDADVDEKYPEYDLDFAGTFFKSIELEDAANKMRESVLTFISKLKFHQIVLISNQLDKIRITPDPKFSLDQKDLETLELKLQEKQIDYTAIEVKTKNTPNASSAENSPTAQSDSKPCIVGFIVKVTSSNQQKIDSLVNELNEQQKERNKLLENTK